METVKITNAMLETCYLMNIGRAPQWGASVTFRCAEAGLVTLHDDFDHTATLTDAGREAAAAWRKKLDARNRASRGRSSAMRSLGLVRTPYGWE